MLTITGFLIIFSETNNIMGKPKFEIFKGKDQQHFHFLLKAGNGEVILASHGFTTKVN